MVVPRTYVSAAGIQSETKSDLVGRLLCQEMGYQKLTKILHHDVSNKIKQMKKTQQHLKKTCQVLIIAN